MNNDRELLELSLEMLTHCRVFVTSREKIKHPEGTKQYDNLIEAIRARLSQCDRCGEKNPAEIHTCTPQEPVVWEALVESVRQMRDVQGMDGNWNYDHYMHGLFNGIEFALSLIEVREPRFRDAPEKWLRDQPKARLFSQGGRDD